MLHDRAHDEMLVESRGNVLIVRGLRISSERLGVSGQCDVVEFHRAKDGILLHGREGHWNVYPVEYKRGVPKADRSDEAQLCAQAMCLEEMRGPTIPEEALFYGIIADVRPLPSIRNFVIP